MNPKEDRCCGSRSQDVPAVASSSYLPVAVAPPSRQDEDEIYYVLSGSGELTLNGRRSVVGPGTAILTRSGSSHGLQQVGSDDLIIIIAYQQSSRARGR